MNALPCQPQPVPRHAPGYRHSGAPRPRARALRRTWVLGLVAMLACLPDALGASIKTRVDRDVIYHNESFSLSFEADGELIGEPDFTPLQREFEILNQSRSQNISIVNGRTVRQFVWRLHLMARRTGRVQIPPIRFGADQSNPLDIVVKPSSSSAADVAAQVLMEADVDIAEPFVQQQVILRVRLLRAIQTHSGTLSAPEFEGADVLVERFGDDKTYTSQRAGRRFDVVERRYLLFPQHSGRLTVKPFEFKGEIASRRGSSLFDPFQRGTTRFVRARSGSIDLTVKEALSATAWLPAQRLQLRETWPSQAQFTVGEPITRSIEIEAHGLTAAQLPQLDQSVGNDFKLYREQPKLEDELGRNGVVGRRTESVALVPTAAGAYELPAMTLRWWNTTNQRMEVAAIASRSVVVSAAGPVAVEPAPVVMAPDAQPGQTADDTVAGPGGWRWLALALGCGWLLTLAWIAYSRYRVRAWPARAPPEPRLGASLRQLQRAAVAGDALVARNALIDWAAVRWPAGRPRSLGHVAQLCEPELAGEIRMLERALYARQESDWNGQRLFELARGAAASKSGDRAGTATVLAPLYPAE